jgi:hypothetical protein
MRERSAVGRQNSSTLPIAPEAGARFVDVEEIRRGMIAVG